MIYDAIIAGAGPAGSYLGYLLSNAGYNVAIFEKDIFPREKHCAGGISPKSLKILPFDLSEIIEQKIYKGLVSFKNEKLFVHEVKRTFGITVKRSVFDNLLIQYAITAGAHFFEGVKAIGYAQNNELVQVSTTKGSFKSKFLIGADGAKSIFRQDIEPDNNRQHSALSVFAKIPMDISEIRRYNNAILFDFGIIDNGYGWLFPLKDHVNAGIFSPYPIRAHKKILNDFLSLYPGLRTDNLKYLAAKIPFGVPKGLYQKNRLLLVGDAAGLCEPIFGEGIYNSLRSAEIASECIQKYFGENWENSFFTDSMRKAFSLNFLANKFLANTFYQNINKKCMMNVVSALPRWLLSEQTKIKEKLV